MDLWRGDCIYGIPPLISALNPRGTSEFQRIVTRLLPKWAKGTCAPCERDRSVSSTLEPFRSSLFENRGGKISLNGVYRIIRILLRSAVIMATPLRIWFRANLDQA